MNAERLESILARLPQVSVCVIGDLFLDKYLDIAPSLAEPSRETGLEAHQVTRVRCRPGGGGNVAKNLARLGEDGDGYEARRGPCDICRGPDQGRSGVIRSAGKPHKLRKA